MKVQLVIDHDMTNGFQKSSDMAAVFSAFCGACPVLNADFECSCPELKICQKSQHFFCNTQTLTSNFVFVYVYRITHIFCLRNLTFNVSYCRKKAKTIYCKILSRSRKP